MLPKFPKFKKLELSDQKDVERITTKYPPYSDFNFLSLWAWDIKGMMRISQLHGNLIVKFTDYLTSQPFFSFLGDNKVDETAEALLTFCNALGIEERLKLIPEVTIKKMDQGKFDIKEERDHFDYIYDIKKVSNFLGAEYKKHRKLVKHFEKNKHDVRILNLMSNINRKKLNDLIQAWVKDKNIKIKEGADEFDNELHAFKRLFKSPPEILSNLLCLGTFVDNNLTGFIINEKVDSNYFVAHFGKAKNSYKGINHHIVQKTAKVFLDLGANYWNDQQDLGLPGLRSSKSSYHPAHFLKKYSLSLRK